MRLTDGDDLELPTRVFERTRVMEVPDRTVGHSGAAQHSGLRAVAGAVEELGDVAAGAVVIADGAVVATGYLGTWTAMLAGLGASVTVHTVPGHEPTVESVDAAADAVRQKQPQVVVGVGGGSALDTAKMAAAVAAGPESVAHYALGAQPLPSGPPVVAVPTTAGTGAEVTRTCVLARADGQKVWTWGIELLPRLVVLDPAATATVPPVVTTATGLDALVHAMEAATGRRANDDVVDLATTSIHLVTDHLAAAVTDGTNLDARRAMQRAAFFAGLAIDGGGTGIAHSVGHALASLAHVPHGLAVAAGLAAALVWNVAGASPAYVAVAAALGVADVAYVSRRYEELLGAASFAEAVRRAGPIDVDVEALAAAMADDANQPMLQNNCRLADEVDRLTLAAATVRIWNNPSVLGDRLTSGDRRGQNG